MTTTTTTARGGKRLGAGRPPRPLVEIGRHRNPRAFLLAVMNNNQATVADRLRAAAILMAHERRRSSTFEEIPMD